MAESQIFKIYCKLPVWCQNVVCSMAGLQIRHQRYGKCFRDFLEFLDQSQWWSYAEQLEFQNERLRTVIRHAYDSVPYYRRIMEERNLVPSDIQTVNDLPKLPILKKDDIRKYGHELLSTTFPKRKTCKAKTSGTTGTSLQLVQEKNTVQRQWAIWHRHRRRFGLDVNDEYILFAGRPVIPFEQTGPPFWRRNFPMHQTFVSVHHMTETNLPALVDYLGHRKVKFFMGYPSGIYLLAYYMTINNLTLSNPPSAVVTGAETLLPHQRETIKKAFPGTVVTDQYGVSEACGNISACEKLHYHIDMEFGAIEFLPLSNDLPNLRKIICTGFWNLAMPLIRYEIGDIATVPEENSQCECGRQSPMVTKIDGRIESYIVTPDGKQLGRLSRLFQKTDSIEEAQFIQDCIEKVTVKLVVNEKYSTNDEEQLLAGLRKYLGDVIDIEIEYVDQIPRSANGKFRQIISRVFQERHSV